MQGEDVLRGGLGFGFAGMEGEAVVAGVAVAVALDVSGSAGEGAVEGVEMVAEWREGVV